MTSDIEPGIMKPSEGERSDAQKMEAQSWLADFQTSRSQIQDYQRAQDNLLWVNTAATGAVVTAAIALQSATTPLVHFLLAIPIISGFLGIYWVALGMKTITVSNYIRKKIAPRLQILCSNDDVIGLEAYFREKAGIIARVKILNVITIPAAIAGFTFVVFCVAGLFITAPTVLVSCEWGLKVIWWFSLVLTLSLVFYGLLLGKYFRSKT